MSSWLPSPPSPIYVFSSKVEISSYLTIIMLYSEQLINRELSYISKFTSNIIHLPDLDNCVVDALSCPTAVHPSSASSSASPSALTSSKRVRISPSLALVLLSPVLPPEIQLSTPAFHFSFLPTLQLTCPSVQAMLANPSIQVLPIPYSDSTVNLCNVSASSVRPLVSSSLQKQLFSALHRILHP